MSAPSLLFNHVLERGHGSQSSASRTSTMLDGSSWTSEHELASNAPPSHPYSPYRRGLSHHPQSFHTSDTRWRNDEYGRQPEASNPQLDFSGLIPMYEPDSPETSRADMDLPVWHPSSMAQYTTYPRIESPFWASMSGASGSTQWNSSVGGSRSYEPLRDYMHSPVSSYSSTTSSSPSTTTYYLPPAASTPPSSGPARTPRGAADKDGKEPKSCFHCHVTTTPLWRREPSTQRTLCNACGLYLQQRNKLRPQELIDADIDDEDEPQIPDEEYTGPKCSHCLTRKTSVWRRSKTGAQVCNACGVYQRLRGKERPLALRRNKIKPRTKHAPR